MNLKRPRDASYGTGHRPILQVAQAQAIIAMEEFDCRKDDAANARDQVNTKVKSFVLQRMEELVDDRIGLHFLKEKHKELRARLNLDPTLETEFRSLSVKLPVPSVSGTVREETRIWLATKEKEIHQSLVARMLEDFVHAEDTAQTDMESAMAQAKVEMVESIKHLLVKLPHEEVEVLTSKATKWLEERVEEGVKRTLSTATAAQLNVEDEDVIMEEIPGVQRPPKDTPSSSTHVNAEGTTDDANEALPANEGFKVVASKKKSPKKKSVTFGTNECVSATAANPTHADPNPQGLNSKLDALVLEIQELRKEVNQNKQPVQPQPQANPYNLPRGDRGRGRSNGYGYGRGRYNEWHNRGGFNQGSWKPQYHPTTTSHFFTPPPPPKPNMHGDGQGNEGAPHLSTNSTP